MIKLKKRLKKIVVPIFLSVLCGFICGRLMFSIYEEESSNSLSSNVIYMLEDASYKDYDTMKASTLSANYIYYKEDNKYNTVLAITRDKDNIKKIEDVYDKELKVVKYLLSNEEVNNKIEEYDIKIKNTSDKEEIKNIIEEVINIYKGEDNIKISKIET